MDADFAIIGAGMAGASLAAELAIQAPAAQIVLIEAEQSAGYHATGRSAAFWTESYGGPDIQPLTSASGKWLRDRGFLKPRTALTIARQGQEAELEQFGRRYADLGVRIVHLDRRELEGLIPNLRANWCGGVMEPDCCDIDVAALHQHYLGVARKAGAELICAAGLKSAVKMSGGWRLSLGNGQYLRAKILVNAAGAWADNVAQMATVKPLSITPYRRTMAQLQMANAVSPDLPLVLDLHETFYFKPENGRLWLSPHDETPCGPCDAAPEEVDVATAIARLESVVDWQVVRVEHRWAGLRSFAPDRLPIYGFDRHAPQFFWFAGQGGFGIQTAPAAAKLAAGLLLGQCVGEVDPSRYSPMRFG
jgi:D-arginine dehydrogenase